jgi:hypothetical protein
VSAGLSGRSAGLLDRSHDLPRNVLHSDLHDGGKLVAKIAV